MTPLDHLPIIIERLRQALHPQRIVLFGSYATGTAGPDSDLDLLVVVDRVDDPMAAMLTALRACADLPVPKDIIVTDPQRLQRRQVMAHTIEAEALATGREVYHAA